MSDIYRTIPVLVQPQCSIGPSQKAKKFEKALDSSRLANRGCCTPRRFAVGLSASERPAAFGRRLFNIFLSYTNLQMSSNKDGRRELKGEALLYIPRNIQHDVSLQYDFMLKRTLQTTSTMLDISWSTFSHVKVVDVQGETNQASTFRLSFRLYFTNFSAVRAPPSSSILVKYFMSSSPMPLSCLIFATSDATSASLRMYFRAIAASFCCGNDSMNFVPSYTATRTTTKRPVFC
jgi:hypothetical protein